MDSVDGVCRFFWEHIVDAFKSVDGPISAHLLESPREASSSSYVSLELVVEISGCKHPNYLGRVSRFTPENCATLRHQIGLRLNYFENRVISFCSSSLGYDGSQVNPVEMIIPGRSTDLDILLD